MIYKLLNQIMQQQKSSANSNIINSASVATTSIVIVPSNPSRKGLIIYNNSANSVYIAYGPTCISATKMTAIIPTFQQWVMPVPIYTGDISAIRNAGTGICMSTELTA